MTPSKPCVNRRPGPMTRVLGAMELWHERACQRRELLGMPEQLLKDIGIDSVAAYREYRKPFWRQ